MSYSQPLRLGARGSLLSLAQSQIVADDLQRAHAGLKVEIVPIKTTGDQVQDKPLHQVGGKGVFTREIELALQAGTIDFAVHSYKDVPVTMPLVDASDLVIACVPARQDASDVLVGARSILELPARAIVGTGSPRRKCQLLVLRPDLDVRLIRGNIDTRLRKVREKQYDAILLACAGLMRANLFDPSAHFILNADDFVPAAGQGALALQCRKNDDRTKNILQAVHDPITQQCVDMERAIVLQLQGDCHSPIGALARRVNDEFHLHALIGKKTGLPPMIKSQSRSADALQAVQQVVDDLLAQGAMDLLHGD